MGLTIDKAATQPLLDLFCDVQALDELRGVMRKAEPERAVAGLGTIERWP